MSLGADWDCEDFELEGLLAGVAAGAGGEDVEAGAGVVPETEVGEGASGGDGELGDGSAAGAAGGSVEPEPARNIAGNVAVGAVAGVSGFAGAAAEGRVLGVSAIAGCDRVAGAAFGGGVVTTATGFSRGGISIACASQPMASPATRAVPAAAKSIV